MISRACILNKKLALKLVPNWWKIMNRPHNFFQGFLFFVGNLQWWLRECSAICFNLIICNQFGEVFSCCKTETNCTRQCRAMEAKADSSFSSPQTIDSSSKHWPKNNSFFYSRNCNNSTVTSNQTRTPSSPNPTVCSPLKIDKSIKATTSCWWKTRHAAARPT